MRSKILIALLMLLPFTKASALFDDESSQGIDQFFLTMGTSIQILCHAVDLAREHNYQYVKILHAEYTLGNQSGGFTCQLEDENQPGRIINFEDETFRLVISCFHNRPDDTDYIDIEEYRRIIDASGLDEDNPSFDFDGDYDDDDDWND